MLEAIRYPINVSNTLNEEWGVIVGTKAVPPEVVDAYYPGNEFKHLVPQSYQYLFDPNFLAANAVITVPHESTKNHRYSPSYWARAIPTFYGEVPINDKYVYGIGNARGVGLSGYYFHSNSASRHKAIRDSYPSRGVDEVLEAEKERFWSKKFHAVGFRASVPQGHMSFHTRAYMEFLSKSWSGDHEAQKLYELAYFLPGVEGSIAGALYRIMGVGERILVNDPDNLEIVNLRYSDVNGIYRRQDIFRAAQLFSTEFQKFPDEFARYFCGTNLNPEQIAEQLDALHEEIITPYTIAAYLDVFIGIVGKNAASLQSLFRDPEVLQYDAMTILSTITDGRDICFAGVTGDFQEIQKHPAPPQLMNPIWASKFYLTRMSQVLADWVSIEWGHYFGNDIFEAFTGEYGENKISHLSRNRDLSKLFLEKTNTILSALTN